MLAFTVECQPKTRPQGHCKQQLVRRLQWLNQVGDLVDTCQSVYVQTSCYLCQASTSTHGASGSLPGASMVRRARCRTSLKRATRKEGCVETRFSRVPYLAILSIQGIRRRCKLPYVLPQDVIKQRLPVVHLIGWEAGCSGCPELCQECRPKMFQTQSQLNAS